MIFYELQSFCFLFFIRSDVERQGILSIQQILNESNEQIDDFESGRELVQFSFAILYLVHIWIGYFNSI